MLVRNLFLAALALPRGMTTGLSDGVFRELQSDEFLPECPTQSYESHFFTTDIAVDIMTNKCTKKDMESLGKWIQAIVDDVGDSMPEYKGDITETKVCKTPTLTGVRRLQTMRRKGGTYTYTGGGTCSRCTSANYRFLSAAYTDGIEMTREDMDKVGNMKTLDSYRRLLGHLSLYPPGKSLNKPDSGSTYSRESPTKERKLAKVSPTCAEAEKTRQQNELAQKALTTASSSLVEVNDIAADHKGNSQVSSIVTEVKVAHETVKKESKVTETAAALALKNCQKEVSTSSGFTSFNLEATKRLTTDAKSASTRAQEALRVIKDAREQLDEVIPAAIPEVGENVENEALPGGPLQYIVSSDNPKNGVTNWPPEDEVKDSMEAWFRKYGDKLVDKTGPFLMKMYSTTAGGCLAVTPKVTVTITEVEDPDGLLNCPELPPKAQGGK